MATWLDFNKEIKVSEGSIPHMYLDTVGKVTVGVGNMLPDVASAQKLAFINRKTLMPATKDEIKTDFETVSKLTKGRIASFYKSSTALDLPSSVIESLLNNRIDGFKRELKLRFPNFETYPMTVQFALLDMAFNLGTNGLVSKFAKFKKAIEDKDWKNAASESRRPQVSSARNATVKKWLEDAK
jgi:GH24 family phage-related lysozyme (muramidase)